LGKIAIPSAVVKAQRLAEGRGWHVHDVICTSGPGARAFEERHDSVCVAMVMEGSFQCRSSTGSALLAPGALMLGNPGQCYECGHEHATGDRCLSFHFDPAFIENVVAAVPGARRLQFPTPNLPPSMAMAPLFAEAELARDEKDAQGLQEIAVRVAGAAVAASADNKSEGAANSRDGRRITAAVRRIESDCDSPLDLNTLARGAAMSPYHFLRTFRAVVGMTPHQFLLQTRLRRTAILLRRTRDSIASIAFEAGFGDLSTFNRQFRRILGRAPGEYRRADGLSVHLQDVSNALVHTR
jgi:AraC family transcriptional regulator